jgi:hypothetical protein
VADEIATLPRPADLVPKIAASPDFARGAHRGVH